MKLIISSSELLRGVMAVAKAIPAKSPLPILENFLFDLKGNMLEITASDSELTLKTQIEVESTAEEGRIAVPAKHMMDLLKELPDQPLTISTSSDSSFVCSWQAESRLSLTSLQRIIRKSQVPTRLQLLSSSLPRAS